MAPGGGPMTITVGSAKPSALRELGRRAYAGTVDAAIHTCAAILGRTAALDFAARSVRIERDLPYAPRPACRLDVYVPPGEGPRPCALYLHGGGFQLGSKRSHGGISMPLVTAGFVVVMIDYRLAPQHPFPAALEDAADAYLWVLDNAARFGGDPSRILVLGESAGANLTLALALCATQRSAAPFAQRVFDAGVVPRAIAPICGLLQASDPERFARASADRGERLNGFVLDRMRAVSERYLSGADGGHGLDLADPLSLLESSLELSRAFPAAFVSCAGGDPLLDDSVRLARALSVRGVPHTLFVEPGQFHAYQAFVITRAAQRHWDAALDFLLPALAPERASPG